MTVAELIEKLEEFPKDLKVVIFPEEGWSDIVKVAAVFEDFVAIMPPDVIL